VPLSFYLVTRVLSKDKIVLPPYYHVEEIKTIQTNGQSVQDTVYHQVADLEFTNQFGETIYLNSSPKGKLLAVSLIDLSDTAKANDQTRSIAILQKAFRKTGMKQNDTIVHFVTISVQPDSPAALRAYAEHYQINQDRWWFLTTTPEVVHQLWKTELGLNNNNDDQPPIGMITLLDKDRNIRGYYNALDQVELRDCANDIGWLALEKKRKKSQ